MKQLRIGTRGSALALWQARAVAAALHGNGMEAELVIITTRGDARQDTPLAALGGKGVFVTEIHEAMRRGEVDLAVHSAKDMAATAPEGLVIAAVLPREDPRDALVLPQGRLEDTRHTGPLAAPLAAPRLRELRVIGTGSPRRSAQLRRAHASARFEPIRGNVDTRLRKLDAGEVDALVLACAGLRRLGLAERISAAMPVDQCLPAPGQGIIAIEARADDAAALEAAASLNHASTRSALAAEQAVVAALGGGCQLPLGVLADIAGTEIFVQAVAASLDGLRMVRAETRGRCDEARAVGERLAQALAARGAMELLHT